MSTAKDQTVLSGHLITINVWDKSQNKYVVVGKAQGLDAERSFGTEPVYEIGSIMPQEHVHNRYEGSLTLERFFVRKNDLVQAGFAALNDDILTKGGISIMIQDKLGDATGTGPSTIRTYHGCSLVSYRETFRVGALAGENATFTYLRCDTSNAQ